MPHCFFYPDKTAENFSVIQFATAETGARGLAELVADASVAAIKEKGSFTLVSFEKP